MRDSVAGGQCRNYLEKSNSGGMRWSSFCCWLLSFKVRSVFEFDVALWLYRLHQLTGLFLIIRRLWQQYSQQTLRDQISSDEKAAHKLYEHTYSDRGDGKHNRSEREREDK